MILVTVGTHEQPFDRLIQCIDEIAREHILNDEFIVQRGFGRYQPQFCRYEDFFTYTDMVQLVSNARIVITHGAPSSFIMPLKIGKIPIVVPRKKCFREHINDHQVCFVREFAEKQHNILVAEDMAQLPEILLHYDTLIRNMPHTFQSNNSSFCRNIERLAKELVEQK